jgi:integral membrane sensor domain MASE1
MRHFSPSVLLSFVCAAFLGVGAVILPVWLLSLRPYPAPLFPQIRSGVEGMSYLTFVFLFVSGLLLGLLGKGHPFLLGLATLALLPLLAIAEMVVSPTSHNLWPLEFAIYGFISLSAILGAYIGRFIQKRVRRSDV